MHTSWHYLRPTTIECESSINEQHSERLVQITSRKKNLYIFAIAAAGGKSIKKFSSFLKNIFIQALQSLNCVYEQLFQFFYT